MPWQDKFGGVVGKGQPASSEWSSEVTTDGNGEAVVNCPQLVSVSEGVSVRVESVDGAEVSPAVQYTTDTLEGDDGQVSGVAVDVTGNSEEATADLDSCQVEVSVTELGDGANAPSALQETTLTVTFSAEGW